MIEHSLIIKRSQEDLFSISRDYTRRLDWDPFPESYKFLNGNVVVKRLQILVRAKNGQTMVVEYISYDPPKAAAIKMVKGPWFIQNFAGSWVFREPINLVTSWALSDGGSYGVEFSNKDGMEYILSINGDLETDPKEFPFGYAIRVYGVYIPFFVPKNSDREKLIARSLDKTIKSHVSKEEFAKFSDATKNEEVVTNTYWPLFVVSEYLKRRNIEEVHSN